MPAGRRLTLAMPPAYPIFEFGPGPRTMEPVVGFLPKRHDPLLGQAAHLEAVRRPQLALTYGVSFIHFRTEGGHKCPQSTSMPSRGTSISSPTGTPDRQQVNLALKRQGRSAISPRTYSHYLSLLDSGFRTYVPINKFDVFQAIGQLPISPDRRRYSREDAEAPRLDVLRPGDVAICKPGRSFHRRLRRNRAWKDQSQERRPSLGPPQGVSGHSWHSRLEAGRSQPHKIRVHALQFIAVIILSSSLPSPPSG